MMNPEFVDASLRNALVDYRGSVLDELRMGAIRWAIVALAIGSGAMLLGAISISNPVDPHLFLLIAGLFAVSGIAAAASRRHMHVGALILVVGLVLVFSAAVTVVPGIIIAAPWASVVVLTAAVVLGWRPALLAVLVTGGVLLVNSRSTIGSPLDPSVTDAMLLSLANLLIYALSARPFRRVLDWTWSSYLLSLQRTSEARERQAELVRLSKSLTESYYRLEQLNLELERARRDARKAQQLKAQFAAAVSHELRTPLNLVIGYCEMMVLSPESAYGQLLPASYRGDIEAIYRNSCHISNLIDDILDLSQIDAGRMALHREWTSMRQIVDETVATVETLFRDREVFLGVELSRDLPPLFVDRTRVRQILINWLANAARFTEQGGVTIRAALQPDAVIVSVSDTGPGIPPEEQSLLFEEFSQVGGKRWQKGGSGLGLAVSKRFAELHGGTTWVESTLGMGSTFFLKLPLSVHEEPNQERDRTDWDDRLAVRVHGQVQPRVLVIDDAGYARKIFQRYLDGYDVVDVDTFQESRRLGQKLPLHAVIVGAPDDLARWRTLQDGAPDLDGVLLLTCPLHTPQEFAEEMGVTDYLVKPVTRRQLHAALQKIGQPAQRVLVVDDDPDMNQLLERMVQSLYPGGQIWCADTGQQAVELLRRNRPDVVLLDLLMPLVDGYAVLQATRTDPDLFTLPVIVVTARGLRDEAIVAGSLSLSRAGGLTVADVMHWFKTALDLQLHHGRSARGPRAAPVE